MPQPSDPGDRGDSGRSPFETAHLQTGLKRRSVRGIAVTMAAQGVKVAAQFATIIILARLLTPEDFGVFAIVLALLGLLELFKDLGLSGATVQRSDISQEQVSTLFWLNVGLGMLAALALAAAAPLLARMFGHAVLADLTPVVALTLVVTGLAAQHLALLRRQMRFAALAALQTGAELAGMAAAIAAAFSGMGLWSLAVQRLTWAGTMTIGAWIVCRWRPGGPRGLAAVRQLVAFGGNSTGAMILGNAAANLYAMAIGWFWGAAPLGLYGRAQKLVQMPVRNINVPLSAVALPMLSRLVHDPARYRRAYRAIVARVAMAMAPLAALIVAGASPLVSVVLGPAWSDAAPILIWMGVSAVFMPVTYSLSWLYMSQDRTGEMLRASVINTVLTMAAFALALPHGLAAIAASYALSGILLRVPLLFYLAGRSGPVTAGDLGGILILPAIAATVGSGTVWLVGGLPEVAGLEPAPQLVLFGLITLVSALAVYGVVPDGRRTLVETVRLPSLLRAGGAGA